MTLKQRDLLNQALALLYIFGDINEQHFDTTRYLCEEIEKELFSTRDDDAIKEGD